MLSETKIDDSFPNQFLIKGFGDSFRIYRNVNGEGILFYVREIFRQNFYLMKLYQQNRVFFVEIDREKWLVSYSYNPHRDSISIHLQTISKSLDF